MAKRNVPTKDEWKRRCLRMVEILSWMFQTTENDFESDKRREAREAFQQAKKDWGLEP